MLQAYEERFLFLLLLLRQPRARLVYVTSQTVNPSIVDYYLGLLPGIIPSHARKRLHLVSPLDGSSRPLSAKLLERPRLLEQIRSLVPDPDRAHLVPFNTTELERDLALALGIPMYGADPRFFPYGTKTGCRRLFAEQGVRYPLGREDLSTTAERGGGDRRAARRASGNVAGDREAERGRVGRGQRAAQPRRAERRRGHRRRSRSGCASSSSSCRRSRTTATRTCSRSAAAWSRSGSTGEEFRSPSVQMRVTPLGKLEVLSTHDQLLGGPSGQSYLGCIFPADPGYATAITREAVKVGERLAKEGVIGRFAMDFVAVKSADGELGAVRDRAQPPQGRHDPPVPHAPVPHGRRIRLGGRAVHRPERQAEVLRRLGSRGEPRVPGVDGGGPLRPRRANGPPFRPVAPDRRRLPHDERPRRVGAHRV